MEFDRRQRKTKAAVRSALISLLLEKDISEVSVTDIARRADINRSTFYLHYRDAEDVLDEMETEIADGIVRLVAEKDMSEIAVDIYPIVKTVYDGLEAAPELKQFLSRDGGMSVYYKIQNSLSRKLVDLLSKQKSTIDRSNAEAACVFVTGGVFGAFGKWMNSESRPPLEKLCAFLSKMITHGIEGLLK